MAKQTINLGAIPTGVGGDTPRSANTKINANFDEVYSGEFSPLLSARGASLGRLQASSSAITTALSAVDGANEATFATFTNHGIGVYLNSIRRGGWDTAGNFTATSINPISTSDVKDNLEGYSEDACEVLDRLVVINYKYRPEFLETDKNYVGFLQENVKSVIPDASTDSYFMESFDDDGNSFKKLIPGNIDSTQILAVSVRSHQRKNRRIKQLEQIVSSLVERLDAAGI